MSRIAPRRISLALDGLTADLAPMTTVARVQQVWERTVGETIAEAGRPTHERDGVLTVVCADAVWAAELDLMSSELVLRLNKALGGDLIQRLRCRAG